MPLKKSIFCFLSLIAVFLLTPSFMYAAGPNTSIIDHTPIPQLKDSTPLTCPKSPEIEKIINEAISIGAPVYNAGLHMACYRIYEWAAYKILYEYSNDCREVQKVLKTAIERSHGDYSDTEKAWLMRAAFDKILGEPTKMGAPDNSATPRKG